MLISRQLLVAVRQLIIPFVRDADAAATLRSTGKDDLATESRNVLVDQFEPADLAAKLKFVLPNEGQGKEGLLDGIAKVLRYSVNTWDQGFMDKLYSSNTPVSEPETLQPQNSQLTFSRLVWLQIWCCPY